MEGSQLQARLEEEAVPGLLPGVKADPLVGGVCARKAKDRVRISPLRKAGQQSRRTETLTQLLWTKSRFSGFSPVRSKRSSLSRGSGAPCPSPADRRGKPNSLRSSNRGMFLVGMGSPGIGYRKTG
jgi:hypothetical protein